MNHTTNPQQIQHYEELKNALFSSSDGNPNWLKNQANDCVVRYGKFHLIPQFNSAINAFANTTIKPFELFVLGEGKFGKSTLVNALLGEELSKVKGLPETRCFLRYEITDEIKNDVQIFMRLKPQMHDWIVDLVGYKGESVDDLFEIKKYHVKYDTVKHILKEESHLLGQDKGYESAVYEVQRFINISHRTSFPAGVRIVDTQGLDQLFPEDLKRITAKNIFMPKSKDLFLDWMSNTSRGKHLEWQYRRCDAVLWCINAKRLGSAATEASLTYFSQYPKKIIIAITNIDLVARNDKDLNRILEKAKQKYGDIATAIIPVNGKNALQAVLSDNSDVIAQSGLVNLQKSLFDACVNEGAQTRSISRYLGLRETELQFRRALFKMKDELIKFKKKYDSDIDTVNKTRNNSIFDCSSWINKESNELVSTIRSRIRTVDLKDDQFLVKRKLDVDGLLYQLSLSTNRKFKDQVTNKISRLANTITPYSIPKFDAEGSVDGYLKKLSFHLPNRKTPNVEINFTLRLDSTLFKRWEIGIQKFLGIFSEKQKYLAKAKELQAINERHASITSQFEYQWGSTKLKWARIINDEINIAYDLLISEINNILHSFESLEGETINASCTKIAKALDKRSSNNIFMSQFLGFSKCSMN